jgi:predicted deacylase
MSPPRPIELQAPDLSRWAPGNTGTPYVWGFDSGHAGPQVMVQALTHGNEICGAIALDALLAQQDEWRPQQGRLMLAFGNIDAHARWDPTDPDRSRYVDEDFNRVWGDEALFGPRDSVELRRARELRPFVDQADLLLDIHSMRGPCAPLMVCGTTGRGGEKGAALSRRMQVPGTLLIDTGHPAGLRMIERGPFADPQHARTAVLIECGQHWEKGAVDVAVDTLFRFLRATGAVNASICKSNTRLAPPGVQKLIRVTEAVVVKSMDFKFPYLFKGLEVIPQAGTVVATDGGTVWRTPYDHCVMVMPSLAHVKPGATVLRLGRYD